MKLLTLLLGIFLIVNPGFAEDDAVLKTEKDKLSYAIGMNIGNNLKRQALEEYRDTMTAFEQKMKQKQVAQIKELSEKNKQEGEAFLAENRKKDAVITLPSGLQYKVIKKGSGKTPKATDTVTVNYMGSLINGTEFDSSYRRGQPASFKVNGVIRGWTEALQLMQEGAKWQLYIPSDLAYGERGAGRDIGPYSTLIFEVELISIEDQAAK
jgi:FKBP-type peptidyl-prolyl cis-trans isomerase FklB